jgi:hypothetical protein
MTKPANARLGADGRSLTIDPIEGTVRLRSPFDLEPGTARRFLLRIGSHDMRFIQRPVSTPASEGTIAFLDGLSDKGNHKRAVGTFRDGEWRGGKGGAALPFRPLTWTVVAKKESNEPQAADNA